MVKKQDDSALDIFRRVVRSESYDEDDATKVWDEARGDTGRQINKQTRYDNYLHTLIGVRERVSVYCWFTAPLQRSEPTRERAWRWCSSLQQLVRLAAFRDKTNQEEKEEEDPEGAADAGVYG